MERRNDERIGCGPWMLALPVIVLMMACGITEITKETKQELSQDELTFPRRTVCCVTGFEYPSGYDWAEENNPTGVKCSLVVFVDAVPRLKVAVGDGYEVGRDHDSHRFMGGALYTYFCKDGVTVIKRNGRPLYRYEADEVMVDMFLKGADLHVLAHKASGGGFSYRKNGKLLLEKLSGDTFGKFWEDGDSLCFSFMQPVATSDAIVMRYYLAYESNVVHVPYGPDISNVWDLMSQKGMPCSLVTSSVDGKTFLRKGGESRSVGIPKSAEMLSGSLFSAEGRIGSECTYIYPDGTCESGIWVEGSEYMRFEIDRTIASVCCSGGKVYCVVNPDADAGLIYNAGDFYKMPEGYMCIGSHPASVHEGELYVALSSREGDGPLIWHDGQVDSLRMNGYISSISFVESEDD